MQKNTATAWARIGFFNLLLVACYGVLMRYKIAFEFPYFDQKNLQHAHSHFAFSGWISQMLMAMMVQTMASVSSKRKKQFNTILIISLVCSYGMLVSFTMRGYWFLSIFFATASVLISFIFGWLYYTSTKNDTVSPSRKWLIAAILFNVLSALGTFYLSYMMAAKNINQHAYLASIYWYLHFQYNGYFLFASIGLFVHYLQLKNILLKSEKTIFKTFVFSCLPSYGLSVLWLNLPVWIYVSVILAGLLQLYGWTALLRSLFRKKIFSSTGTTAPVKWLFAAAAIAMSLKILLQTASTLPALSKLAFGFRPIVIAYLHLVLLGIFTLFITGYVLAKEIVQNPRTATIGVYALLAGVLANEMLLAVQGVCSLFYIVVPGINEMLLGAAILLAGSILLICLSQLRKKPVFDHTAIL